MKRSYSLILMLLVCLAASQAWATGSINVGTISLQPNQAGQIVEFQLTVTNPTAVNSINGFEFNIQVGDGGADLGGSDLGPVITGINLVGGTIWATATSPTQANVVEFDLARQSSVDFATPIALTGTPIIARVEFSTLGIGPNSTAPLLLTGVAGSFDTKLFAGASEVPLTITNGFVTTVPEPASLAMVAVAAVALTARRRRVA
jgi:hypothetical protein